MKPSKGLGGSSSRLDLVAWLILALAPVLNTNAVGQDFGANVQHFPQFAIGGGAETSFTIHNPGAEAISVRLTLRRSDGSLFFEDRRGIEAGATRTMTLRGGADAVTAGWALLTSEGLFTATLFYKIAGVGNVGVLPSAPSEALKLFSFIQGTTDTGFAIANPSQTEEAELRFRIFKVDGEFEGEATIRLGPQQHLARFFSEAPLSLQQDALVELTSNVALVAVSLRLDDGLLSSVPVVTPGETVVTPGSITTELIADGAVTGEKIADGAVVKSINGIQDHLLLEGGANVSISSLEDRLVVSADSPPGPIGPPGPAGPQGPAGTAAIVIRRCNNAVSCSCSAGEILTGGGASCSFNDFLVESRPQSTTTWTISCKTSEGEFSTAVRIQILCAPGS